MMLRDLVDRAFFGSAGNLALQALSTKRSSPEELREIRSSWTSSMGSLRDGSRRS